MSNIKSSGKLQNDFIDKGSLLVDVFSLSEGKPVSGAFVTVTQKDSNLIVERVQTDLVGGIGEILLPAPPLEYSLNVDQPKPYSEYDVYVSYSDYEQVKINGVQIFSSTTAIQNIILRPLEAKLKPIEINISEPVLWGDYPPKIPETEVKRMPPESGFIVLPKPVIPEYVVVHNGRPEDTYAQNYTVPFKEYIKNVASCEIYSTWPKETIKANVLAILSFTLNRVYTEWYRSKGYNFTITNSTAFDQAFSYGRNLFQEISEVVDEIFTTYISKPSIRQPLFTQYCDGQRTTCPNWLSQWGSKYLGDEGYEAIGILKNYYGNEIILKEAEKVEGIPESYPGYALSIGSTGPAVTTIQEQLNAISEKYPLIKKVRVDGIFGEATNDAVEIFQEIFRLPVTGVVDLATWYKISSIFVAVEKYA
ncbi:MAG: peptidoglycan-binding protein [Aminipila sp.]